MGFQGNDLPSMPRGGGGLADLVLGGAETAVAGALLVGFVAAGYALITIDRRRDGSTSRDDGQVGLKLALWGVIVAGVVMAAGGLGDLLAFVLGGFKGGWAGLEEKWPAAYQILTNYQLSVEDQQPMMGAIDVDGGSVEDVVAAWMSQNEDKWRPVVDAATK